MVKPRPTFAIPALLALQLAAAACAAGALPLATAGAAANAAAPADRKPGAVLVTPHVRAELVAHAPQGVQRGKPLWLGLAITHQPQWHTYWKNAGDSGLPTTLAWTLPSGFAAGGIAWPTPERLPLGPLVNYGYQNTVLLPVPVAVPAGFAGDTLTVKLHAEWLVCKVICLPESGDFALAVPARLQSARHQALFDATRAATPTPLPGAQGTARVDGAALAIEVRGLPAAAQGQPVDVLLEDGGVIDNAGKIEHRWDGAVAHLRVPLSAQRSESPDALHLLLTSARHLAGWTLTVPVAGGWPGASTPVPAGAAAGAAIPGAAGTAGAVSAGAAPGAAGPGAAGPVAAAPDAAALAAQAPSAALPIDAGAASGTPAFFGALLFALLGGALLNLMPCVFPVLSLKIFSLAQYAGQRRQAVAGGLAYTAGVVLSFVALAGLLLALRAGGEQLGWGFQLQSPSVVALLAALFTLIGLNLAGVFEFGTLLPGRLAAYRASNPLLDDALGGALAVAIASPCTAPFMGAALGAALTEPAPAALAIFAALGLGMAAPYLAASLWPGLARIMPKPGAWMQRFKVLMAFPMFATVVWLAWVLGQQAGIDAMAGLLGLLVALAYAAWTFATPARTGWARALLAGSGAIVLAAAAALVWPALHAPDGSGTAGGTASRQAGAAPRWSPWSPQAVAQARAAGRPVFVDFTAAWCVTCQYNKRTALADPGVQAAFDARNVLLLRADWTRRDPAITQQLAQFGRNGVPVYALYSAGSGEPQLLSELLTVDKVKTALNQL